MAYKCNTCNSTSDEAKECCGAPMTEDTDAAKAPAEAPAETPKEGEAASE